MNKKIIEELEENSMVDVVEILKHFGLRTDPFAKMTSGDIFRSANYKRAMTLLGDWLGRGEMCAIIGSYGSGKSVMLNDFTEWAERHLDMDVVHVGNPDRQCVTPGHVYDAVQAHFGRDVVKFSGKNSIRFRELKEFLGVHMKDRRVVIALDEGQHLNKHMLASCKEFSEMSYGTKTDLLGVLFVGWPSFLQKLAAAAPDIYGRVRVANKYVYSDTLMAGECEGYVRHCVRRAGAPDVFTAAAQRAIGVLAKTPLRVCEYIYCKEEIRPG